MGVPTSACATARARRGACCATRAPTRRSVVSQDSPLTTGGCGSSRVWARTRPGCCKSISRPPTRRRSRRTADPRRYTLQAVAFLRQRLEWEVVDSSVAGDLAALKAVHDGDFTIDSRDVKDAKWIVSYNVPDGPIYYYVYDRATKRGELLFTHRPKLEQYTLAKMQAISFTARDGMTIYGYLTLPAGVEPKNLPLVLDVHGGPWGRDTWGWNR